MSPAFHNIDALVDAPISVSAEVLADLRRRLENVRWAPDRGNDDEYYGVST